jgi:hypothetical protein
MKWLVLLVTIILLTFPVYAEESLETKLARIEERVKSGNEISFQLLSEIKTELKTTNARVDSIERRVDKHGTWWSAVWAVLGILFTAMVGIAGRVFGDWFAKRPKMCSNEN